MHCPRCKRPMLALFYSTICEACDGPPRGDFFAGFVMWDPAWPINKAMPTPAYVWRTSHDAIAFRSLRESDDLTVRCVLSEFRIPWREAGGKAAGLVCGDALYEIYTDHRFPPARYRAFLAKPGFHAYAERITLAA